MKLSSLIAGLDCKVVRGSTDKEIRELIYFSEKAVPGSMFFAVPGAEKDGCCYIDEAVKKGAEAVVVEKGRCGFWCFGDDVTLLEVEDVRKAMALMSRTFYHNPCEGMMVIGVTGTKGKTSTCFMIREILECSGIKTGIIGTIKNGFEGHFEEADRTTPQSVEVYRLCREMKNGGCEAVVMEVSSQGLMQSRVEGINFDVAVFTNFSPDHIGPGEHADLEEYFRWKQSLFKKCSCAVINMDDESWMKIAEECTADRIFTFGSSEESDYCFRDAELFKSDNWLGMKYTVLGEEIIIKAPGRFNAENSAAAAAVGRILGCDWKCVKEALYGVKIPGRGEIIDSGKECVVMVDYAHNGKALKELLNALREYEPSKLTVVFGCGGNRDKNRRKEMGEAAARFADFSIITSDNPRNENPLEIIDDIVRAVEAYGGEYTVIPDRGEAIRFAVETAQKGDIVVVAGKGHETYQIIGNEKKHFDDKEFILMMNRG